MSMRVVPAQGHCLTGRRAQEAGFVGYGDGIALVRIMLPIEHIECVSESGRGAYGEPLPNVRAVSESNLKSPQATESPLVLIVLHMAVKNPTALGANRATFRDARRRG